MEFELQLFEARISGDYILDLTTDIDYCVQIYPNDPEFYITYYEPIFAHYGNPHTGITEISLQQFISRMIPVSMCYAQYTLSNQGFQFLLKQKKDFLQRWQTLKKLNLVVGLTLPDAFSRNIIRYLLSEDFQIPRVGDFYIEQLFR